MEDKVKFKIGDIVICVTPESCLGPDFNLNTDYVYVVAYCSLYGVRLIGESKLYNPKRFALYNPEPKYPTLADLVGYGEPRAVDEVYKKSPDVIKRPNHYARFVIQPIDFITQNKLEFWQGNIIKYVVRYDAKDGLQDLKKAREYLDKKINLMENENS